MILSLDRDLDSFFSWLDKNVGLDNVWLALTADHGIGPIPGEAAKLGMNSAAVNTDAVYATVNEQLDQRYSRGEKVDYLLPGPDLPYVVLDERAFKMAGVDEKTAEELVAGLLQEAVTSQAPKPDGDFPVQQRLPPTPHAITYTHLELANGPLPPTKWGGLLAHSYADHGNWFVMLILDAYQSDEPSAFAGTNHFTPWSYDRHVPLAFYGAPFLAGEYHEQVEPVDLAVTFASLAGVNLPSAAVGRVLIEALKPVRAAG